MNSLLSELINDSLDMTLPIIQICRVGDKIIITTRKVASSSVGSSGDRHIQFFVKDNSNHTVEGYTFFDDWVLEYLPLNWEGYMTFDEFCNMVGVDRIEDLFKHRTINGYTIELYIRNPIKRLLSGFVETVDTTMSEEVKEIQSRIIHDEHLSSWLTFVENIINRNDDHPVIVDIDEGASVDYVHDITVKKNVYMNWLMSDENNHYIRDLFDETRFFLMPEILSYNRLKHLIK